MGVPCTGSERRGQAVIWWMRSRVTTRIRGCHVAPGKLIKCLCVTKYIIMAGVRINAVIGTVMSKSACFTLPES